MLSTDFHSVCMYKNRFVYMSLLNFCFELYSAWDLLNFSVDTNITH